MFHCQLQNNFILFLTDLLSLNAHYVYGVLAVVVVGLEYMYTTMRQLT